MEISASWGKGLENDRSSYALELIMNELIIYRSIFQFQNTQNICLTTLRKTHGTQSLS